MFKLLIFTALLAIAKCDGIEKFAGTWTPVKVFPAQPHSRGCRSILYETTNVVCNCGDDIKAPIVKISNRENRHHPNEIPVVVAENANEVSEGLNSTCTCNGVESNSPPMVFRYINSNYFTSDMYIPDEKLHISMLFAKDIPTVQEMDNFIENTESLKWEGAATMCASDMRRPHHRY
ncbi:hypothetical protein NE865_11707 [Phthorimaea operculella]|nr:hypothetical protein NE865_11707 [Phthorimaea operculella]